MQANKSHEYASLVLSWRLWLLRAKYILAGIAGSVGLLFLLWQHTMGAVIFLVVQLAPLVASIVFIIAFKKTLIDSATERERALREPLRAAKALFTIKPLDTKLWNEVLLSLLSLSNVILIPIRALFAPISIKFPALIEIIPNPALFWCVIEIALAIQLEKSGNGTLALFISCSVCGSAFYASIVGIMTRNGHIDVAERDLSASSPGRILMNALTLAAGFGCIHWHIAKWDEYAYTGLNSWKDGMYFSLTTLTTVGYGDITPSTDLSRGVSAIEIVCGTTLLVIAVTVHANVWFERRKIPKSD